MGNKLYYSKTHRRINKKTSFHRNQYEIFHNKSFEQQQLNYKISTIDQ